MRTIEAADLEGKGVAAQADCPGLSGAEMRAAVEELVRSVVIPIFNQNTAEADAAIKNRYTKAETNSAIDAKVLAVGAGDMSKAEYAGSAHGIVKQADAAIDEPARTACTNAQTAANAAVANAAAAQNTANAAMPKTGGTFTGDVIFSTQTMFGTEFGKGVAFGTSARMGQNGTGVTALCGDNGAQVLNYTGGAFKSITAYSFIPNTSSIRYKERIFDMADEEAKLLLQLRPVEFYRKNEPDKRCTGFIAEEVENIQSKFVVYSQDNAGNLQVEALDYMYMITDIVKLCQIQQQQIDALIARAAALEGAKV